MMRGRGGYWRFWAIVPMVAAASFLPGCSAAIDDLPRQPIAGRVIFDGRPLPHGTIMFYPEEVSTREHERVEAGSDITSGWFSVPREKGPVLGKYKISVTSQKEVKSRREDRAGGESRPAAPCSRGAHPRKIQHQVRARD